MFGTLEETAYYLAKCEPVIIEGISNFNKNGELHAPQLWLEKAKNFNLEFDDAMIINIQCSVTTPEDYIIHELLKLTVIFR